MLSIRRKIGQGVVIKKDGCVIMKVIIARPSGRGKNFVQMLFSGEREIEVERLEVTEKEENGDTEINYNLEIYNK